MKVLNTRPREFSEDFSNLLQRAGIETLDFPVTHLKSRLTDAEAARLQATVRAEDWFLFTSRSGVLFLFNALSRTLGEAEANRLFQSVSIGVVGEQTKRAVLERGGTVSFLPSEASSEKFAHEFEAIATQSSGSFFLFRAEKASQHLSEMLRKVERTLYDHVCYEAVETPVSDLNFSELSLALRQRELSFIIFGSSDAARIAWRLAKSGLTPEEFQRFLNLPVAVIGSETKVIAEQLGFQVRLMPERPDFGDLVSLLAAG